MEIRDENIVIQIDEKLIILSYISCSQTKNEYMAKFSVLKELFEKYKQSEKNIIIGDLNARIAYNETGYFIAPACRQRKFQFDFLELKYFFERNHLRQKNRIIQGDKLGVIDVVFSDIEDFSVRLAKGDENLKKLSNEEVHPHLVFDL